MSNPHHALQNAAKAAGHRLTIPSDDMLRRAHVDPCWVCTCGAQGTTPTRSAARDDGLRHLRQATDTPQGTTRL